MQPLYTCPPAGPCCSATHGSLIPSQRCTNYCPSSESPSHVLSVVSILRILHQHLVHFRCSCCVFCNTIFSFEPLNWQNSMKKNPITINIDWSVCGRACARSSWHDLSRSPPWSPWQPRLEPQSSVLLTRQMTASLLCLLQSHVFLIHALFTSPA